MRRQTSNGRRSAVARPIHKNKTCSFRAGQDLSNDILGLKLDWKNDAAVPVQSYRRGSVRWSIDQSLNASYAHFWASLLRRDDHENDHRSSRRCISKYSQSSPRVRQSSPQVRKSLVLCKEKTLSDKVGVIVITDTGANCIAKKERQKAERKCWIWALKTRPPKHGNFVTFLCMQRVPEWIIVVCGIMVILWPICGGCTNMIFIQFSGNVILSTYFQNLWKKSGVTRFV